MSWRERARCAGSPPRPSTCASCPVSEPCLWAALAEEVDADWRYGVRGGCSAARRTRIAASLPADVDYAAAYRAVLECYA